MGEALRKERDLLGEASQAHGELSAFNAGRSQLPLRGSSGMGLEAAPDSLLGLPFGGKHRERPHHIGGCGRGQLCDRNVTPGSACVTSEVEGRPRKKISLKERRAP